MGDVEGLLAKVKWLINELDDARAGAVRLQRALESVAEGANSAEQPRTAPVAANSPVLVHLDPPPPARLSERRASSDWLGRRGNILLACPSSEGLDSQAGL